jgi:hypothetical protein
MGKSDGPAEAKPGLIVAPKSVKEPITPYEVKKSSRGFTADISKFGGMTALQSSVARTDCTNKPPISGLLKVEEYVETSKFQVKSPRKSNVESIASPTELNSGSDGATGTRGLNTELVASSAERNSGNDGAAGVAETGAAVLSDCTASTGVFAAEILLAQLFTRQAHYQHYRHLSAVF